MSRVRVLAITHILVGALFIILGLADGVTSVLDTDYMFDAGFGFFAFWTGTWVSVHCRNSAFLRCKLTYFSPSQPFRFLLPTRSLIAVKIYMKTSPNHSNHFHFARLKAFWACGLKSGLGYNGRFSYSINCTCLRNSVVKL